MMVLLVLLIPVCLVLVVPGIHECAQAPFAKLVFATTAPDVALFLGTVSTAQTSALHLTAMTSWDVSPLTGFVNGNFHANLRRYARSRIQAAPQQNAIEINKSVLKVEETPFRVVMSR